MGAVWTLTGYGVERLLGFGATGEVWRAHELASGDVVALKRLRPGAAGARDLPAQERLGRKAALLAAVRHPHVLPLRSVVPVDDGIVLVLDYAAGGSLDRLLRARGRLTAGEVVTTAGPLAAALAVAHGEGLVHGDVSPANVLYTADGRPLLADLGVARLVGESGRAVDGTPGFVDPVVVAGAEPTTARDVYGLAAVCYRALAGEVVAETRSTGRSRRARRTALRELAPNAPAELVEIVEAGLAPTPRARPDAAAFGARLTSACSATPVRLSVAPPSGAVGRSPAGADPAGADQAGADPAGADPAGNKDLSTHAIRPAAPPPEPASASAPSHSPPSVRQLVLGGTAAVVLAAAMLAGWWWGSAPGVPAGRLLAQPRSTAAPSSPAAVPAPAPAPVPAPAPPPAAADPPTTTDPASWRAVLAGLDGRRAAAFAESNPAVLAEVYVEGSPPYAADVASLRSLVDAGNRARPVRHELQEVRLITRTAAGVTVEVTDEMPAYDVVNSAGAVVGSDPGRGPKSWQVELVLAGDGWRISSLRGA